MISGLQLQQFAIFAALVSMGSATIDYVYIDESAQSRSEETRGANVAFTASMVVSSESEKLQSEANRTQEMKSYITDELKRLLIKCNESAEVHCIEMGLRGGCSGIDRRQDCQPKQPIGNYSGYDRAAECFKG